MGYRIEYDNYTKKYEVRRSGTGRLWILTAVFFALFVVLSGWYWPEGSALIRDILIPGEDAVTVQAFEDLTASLRSGEAVKDAVVVFCREILIGEPAAH